MIERILFEYLINVLWQLPLLLAAAWLLIRVARPRLLPQHILWLATLAIAIVLPLRGVGFVDTVPAGPAATFAVNTSIADRIQFAPVPVNVRSDAQAAPTPSFPPVPAHPWAGYFALRTGHVAVGEAVVHWSVSIYLLLISLSTARLIVSFLRAFKIRSQSVATPLTLLESTLLTVCASRIGLPLARLPALRSLRGSAASPMVIGVRKPFLLLPKSVRHAGNPDFNEHQLMAILTHELAHIRRRDYLVNLLAGIGSLPIAWHPATIVIQARIRQTREMICDAAAAGCFGTSSTYARALLSLAESLIQPQPNVQALGFFDANRKTLEERIMKLTQTQPTSTLPVRIARIATGAVILIAATTAAATLHLRPSAPAVYAAQQTNAPAAAPPVTDESVPPAEAIVIQAPTPAPAAKPAHAPVSEPAPQATIREENRKITPEERKQLDDTLATVREQVRAATAQIDIAKLKQEIGAAKLESVNSPEFKKQMEDMRKSMKAFHLQQQQFATLRPELKQQMEELKLRLTSPEFREQMKLNIPLVVMPNLSAMQSGNLVVRVPDPAFKKRIADAREQMRAEIKQANGDTEQIQKAVDQFVSEVDRATKELVREKTITLPPVPPTPPRPLQ